MDKNNNRLIDEFFGGKNIIKNQNEQLKVIKEYMSKNADALSTPLLEVIVFGSGERMKLIKAFDINEREFRAFASVHPILSLGWETANDVLALALYLAFIHSGKKEYIEFLAIKFLTSKMYKFYTKNGSLNSGIMRFIVYGVKNGKPVMSQKYLLKSEGSTVGMIKKIVQTLTDEFMKKFKKDELLNDDVIVEIVMSLATRVNHNMRGVRDLYDRYKNERLYEQKDISNEDGVLTVENETIKIAQVRSAVTEKVTRGLDSSLIKRTANMRWYDVFKDVYETKLQEVTDYCLYLLDFYNEKAVSISFEAMKRDFVGVVYRAKGIDMSFPDGIAAEYGIRTREFPRSFLKLHVVLVYDVIIKMA